MQPATLAELAHHLQKRRTRREVFLEKTEAAPENIQRFAELADGAACPAVRSEVVGTTATAVPDDVLIPAFRRLTHLLLIERGPT